METTRKNTPFPLQIIETFLEGLLCLFTFLFIGPIINIAWIVVELFFFTIGIAFLMTYTGLGFLAALGLLLLSCYILCLFMVISIHAEGHFKKVARQSASPEEQKNQLSNL